MAVFRPFLADLMAQKSAIIIWEILDYVWAFQNGAKLFCVTSGSGVIYLNKLRSKNTTSLLNNEDTVQPSGATLTIRHRRFSRQERKFVTQLETTLFQTKARRRSSYVRCPKCLRLDVCSQGSRLFRVEPFSRKIHFD